jgi:hypothetical protein
MTTEQRLKAIATMVAGVARHPLMPDELKVGMAALAEELRELRRLTLCGDECSHGKCDCRKCPLK